MPTLGEVARIVEALPPRRSCATCRHCHVLGFDSLRRASTHCHLGLWVDRPDRSVPSATSTRIRCESFAASSEGH